MRLLPVQPAWQNFVDDNFYGVVQAGLPSRSMISAKFPRKPTVVASRGRATSRAVTPAGSMSAPSAARPTSAHSDRPIDASNSGTAATARNDTRSETIDVHRTPTRSITVPANRLVTIQYDSARMIPVAIPGLSSTDSVIVSSSSWIARKPEC